MELFSHPCKAAEISLPKCVKIVPSNVLLVIDSDYNVESFYYDEFIS